jgi:hypothetical protein
MILDGSTFPLKKPAIYLEFPTPPKTYDFPIISKLL